MGKPRRAGDRTGVKNWEEQHRCLSMSSPLSPCPIEKQTNKQAYELRMTHIKTTLAAILGKWRSEKNVPTLRKLEKWEAEGEGHFTWNHEGVRITGQL